MWKKQIGLLALVFCLASEAHAVMVETDDMRLGINGYINTIHTYMSKMPMVMTTDGMEEIGTAASDTSTVENDDNLIFNAVKERLRINMNLAFHNGFSSEGGGGTGGMALPDDEATRGAFRLLEAFGEYAFRQQLQVRAGQFLSPFGIYNQIRFVTPLFAPVVLPMMYQPPEGFRGRALVPGDANLMFSGTLARSEAALQYFLYAGNGDRTAVGADRNKNKGFGGRIRLSAAGQKIGASVYSANDDVKSDPDPLGRRTLYGLDTDLTHGPVNLQAEYARDKAERREAVFSYYGQLTYTAAAWTPFVRYEFFKDKGDLLFGRGQSRFSAGTGYAFNNNVILKGEYHYHRFRNDEGFMGAPDEIHMFRTAAIFIF